MNAREFDVPLPGFGLSCGVRLPESSLRAWVWGPEQDGFHDVVLLVHALTGSAVAGGEGGWWAPLIGPGKVLDPTRHTVLCFNNLGSCYGSFGPRDPRFPTLDAMAEPPRSEGKGAFELPPNMPVPLTSWDQARAILLALDALRIHTVRLTTGGSLGGMVCCNLAMLAPERFRAVAPVASTLRATPWMQGFNHIGRMAILADPGFPDHPHRGLQLARQIAQMTYRAEPGLVSRHPPAVDPRVIGSVQTYLEYQGRQLDRRFDAASYLCQLSAMDHHDVERPPPPPEDTESWTPRPWSLERWRARTTFIGIDSDQLFRPENLLAAAETLGSRARYLEISSLHGHDGFLIEWDAMTVVLGRAMAEADE
ncbi:MAG: alpha/beta fold hydrolase [Myxococcota bacterium]